MAAQTKIGFDKDLNAPEIRDKILASGFARVGYVTKLGAVMKNWKRRIFALDKTRGEIVYFEPEAFFQYVMSEDKNPNKIKSRFLLKNTYLTIASYCPEYSYVFELLYRDFENNKNTRHLMCAFTYPQYENPPSEKEQAQALNDEMKGWCEDLISCGVIPVVNSFELQYKPVSFKPGSTTTPQSLRAAISPASQPASPVPSPRGLPSKSLGGGPQFDLLSLPQTKKFVLGMFTYLGKKGKINTAVQTRFFRTCPTPSNGVDLMYFDDYASQDFQVIELNGKVVIPGEEGDEKKEAKDSLNFLIRSADWSPEKEKKGSRTWSLRADTTENRDRWVQLLRVLCEGNFSFDMQEERDFIRKKKEEEERKKREEEERLRREEEERQRQEEERKRREEEERLRREEEERLRREEEERKRREEEERLRREEEERLRREEEERQRQEEARKLAEAQALFEKLAREEEEKRRLEEEARLREEQEKASAKREEQEKASTKLEEEPIKVEAPQFHSEPESEESKSAISAQNSEVSPASSQKSEIPADVKAAVDYLRQGVKLIKVPNSVFGSKEERTFHLLVSSEESSNKPLFCLKWDSKKKADDESVFELTPGKVTYDENSSKNKSTPLLVHLQGPKRSLEVIALNEAEYKQLVTLIKFALN